ncbi:hypothetical protein Csa_000606 [Cucumis sativus]|uniref:Uncharacterized protein n=1 Tax=Cucumis sativus TaxID=3659 RepID=A0A0A0KJT2_CUCSA|nr:hypothetical protein Csa_000606 [Cucumis sativus]
MNNREELKLPNARNIEYVLESSYVSLASISCLSTAVELRNDTTLPNSDVNLQANLTPQYHNKL